MRVPMLVISLLAAVPCAAAVQAATVVAPEAAVSGVTVTNTGTYKAQSVSAPSGAGQLSPTGTIGTASNWHFPPLSCTASKRLRPPVSGKTRKCIAGSVWLSRSSVSLFRLEKRPKLPARSAPSSASSFALG